MTTRTHAAVPLSLTICLVLIAAATSAQTPSPAPPGKVPAATGEVKVTVKYSGKGTVDSSHRIWVWIFDNPNIGPDSMPLDEDSIDKNGGTVTFTGVLAKEVYIAVAFDEKGGFAGQAPPPAGSPMTMYGIMKPTDKPMAVAPGANGSIVVNLTDMQRMQ